MDSLMGMELSLAVEQRFDVAGMHLALSERTCVRNLARDVVRELRGGGREVTDDAGEERVIMGMEAQHGVTLTKEERQEAVSVIGMPQ
jgi:hypothetical protein